MDDRETVYLKKGFDYSPLHPKADAFGRRKLWYAYNNQGIAVTWADTKEGCIKDARRCGYKVSSRKWGEI